MAARGPQNGRRGRERCLPLGFWGSRQLLYDKFSDQSPPSMRKDRDGEKKKGEKKGEKTDNYSGHYVIASSRPSERQPLERRPLVPIISIFPILMLV